MKALGKEKSAPGIAMLDWPRPECGPNDVLITLAPSSRLSATLSRDKSKRIGWLTMRSPVLRSSLPT